MIIKTRNNHESLGELSVLIVTELVVFFSLSYSLIKHKKKRSFKMTDIAKKSKTLNYFSLYVGDLAPTVNEVLFLFSRSFMRS